MRDNIRYCIDKTTDNVYWWHIIYSPMTGWSLDTNLVCLPWAMSFPLESVTSTVRKDKFLPIFNAFASMVISSPNGAPLKYLHQIGNWW